MLLGVHSIDRFNDLEFAFVGGFPVAGNALSVSQFFSMHRAPTATFGKPELPEPGLYGRRATPQEVGEILRQKPFNHVFLLEKTLVEIPWKFRNYNGINEISGWRRKVAFSWRRPTSFRSPQMQKFRKNQNRYTLLSRT